MKTECKFWFSTIKWSCDFKLYLRITIFAKIVFSRFCNSQKRSVQKFRKINFFKALSFRWKLSRNFYFSRQNVLYNCRLYLQIATTKLSWRTSRLVLVWVCPHVLFCFSRLKVRKVVLHNMETSIIRAYIFWQLFWYFKFGTKLIFFVYLPSCKTKFPKITVSKQRERNEWESSFYFSCTSMTSKFNCFPCKEAVHLAIRSQLYNDLHRCWDWHELKFLIFRLPTYSHKFNTLVSLIVPHIAREIFKNNTIH